MHSSSSESSSSQSASSASAKDLLFDDGDLECVNPEFKTTAKNLLGNHLATKFCEYFSRRETGIIDWDCIEPFKKDDFLLKHDSLPIASKPRITDYLKKLAILKLNGGLGTTMGLKGPKSIIPVRDGKCFLEMDFEHIRYLNDEYGVKVPLILMNSFATEVETKYYVSKHPDLDIRCFNQNRFPRIIRESLLPLPKSVDDPDDCWCPPGHGEVYDCLYHCGLLEQLIGEGKEYIFLSNGDNLGAGVDLGILTRIFSMPPGQERHLVSEQTLKVPADVKGGTVIRYNYNGDKEQQRFRLLETAMVPPAHMHEFASMSFFETFNCNNLWVNLWWLKERLETKTLRYDIFQNFKTVRSIPVIQLESAMGSIVQCVEPDHVDLVLMPRTRFIPTKKCSDLAFVRSSYYTAEHGCLRLNDASILREPFLPTIFFNGPFFEKVQDMYPRLPYDLETTGLVKLETDGDVSYGKGVVVKGRVEIKATPGKSIKIPDGMVLENVLVTNGVDGLLKIRPFSLRK